MAYRQSDIPAFTQISYQNLGNNQLIVSRLNREFEQWLRSKEGIDGLTRRIQRVTGMSEKHARLIARTERTRNQGKARYEAIRDANKNRPKGQKAWKKQWVARKDGKTRDSHESLSGVIQWNDFYFVSGAGNRLLYPGDPRAPASEVCNCRCYIRKVAQE